MALVVWGCVAREPPDGSPATRATLSPTIPTDPWVPGVFVPLKKDGGALLQARLDPQLNGPYVDRFERTIVGNDFRSTSPAWRVVDGQLCAKDARNHPIWLKRRLPINAQISFTAVTQSPEGDIKCEAWGDGESSASQASYVNATSYLFILGGWKNERHVLARLDEHGADRLWLDVDRAATLPRAGPVEPGKVYRFVIERRDEHAVRWLVDGVQMFELTDRKPLAGIGHDHFGFNDWSTEVCFDDLAVVPLPND